MKIKINTIDRIISENGKPNVCKTVHYTASTTKTVGKYDDIKEYNSSLNSMLSLPPVSGDFIEYSKLTEEKVVEWVEELLGKEKLDNMENSLNQQIEEIIAPTRGKGVPW
jgi:hypothetical protein